MPTAKKTTPRERRDPASDDKYNQYYAIRIRKQKGLEWKVYVAKNCVQAIRRAESVDGCIEIMRTQRLTRDEYLLAVDQIKKGIIK